MSYLEELKEAIGKKLLARINSDDCTAADINQGRQWVLYCERGEVDGGGQDESNAEIIKRIAVMQDKGIVPDLPPLDVESDDAAAN